MGSFRVFPDFRAALASLRGERGFTLVESLMATVLLTVVGTSLSGLLASSIATYSSSRERTLAQEAAQDQVEAIRRMPFSSVGLPNGNPSGTLLATRPLDIVGLHATVKLQITYVDDQTPNSYRTYANYKKVVVSVVRNKDSKELTKEVTYLSPAAKNAATESVIEATLLDLGNNTPVVNTTVNLATGPSAPRTDATDASGKAIFPALTANPSSGSQAYYDLNVTAPFGYEMLKDDLPPSGVAHTQLGTAQTWATVLRLYKPCSVNVSVPAPPLNPSTGVPVPYTVSIGSARGTQAFNQSAGMSFVGPVTTIASEPLVPLPSTASTASWILYPSAGSQYSAGAHAVVGSGGTAKYYFATAESKPVPRAYPTDLGQDFSLVGTNWYTAAQVSALTVKVQTAGGSAIGGAMVNVSGGPLAAPGMYVTSPTPTSGTLKGQVTIMVPSGGGYTITAWGPGTTVQLTGQSVTSATTKTLIAT